MSEKRKDIQIYCINLKERTDRWERFMSQTGVKRLIELYPFERFEGVDGKMIDIKNDTRISLRTKRNITYQKRRDHEDLDTAGGIGCYLSHYGCWKKTLESGSQKSIIFEDDAIVPDNFPEILHQALDELNEEAVMRPDVWLLSKPFNNAFTLKRALDLGKIKYSKNWTYDVTGPLTGYILFRSGAKILTENAFPIDGHVDHYMHRCAQMGMLAMAHHEKIVLKQFQFSKKDSDIQQKSVCEICDLPDAPRKKGYLIITNQTITSAIVIAMSFGGLLLLKTWAKK